MRTLLALICLIGCVLTAQTQPVPMDSGLSLKVRDPNGAPVSNVYVHMHNSIGASVEASDHGGGRFEISASPGLYDLFIAAKGFAPTCRAVKIEADKRLALSVVLHPDAEHMEE